MKKSTVIGTRINSIGPNGASRGSTANNGFNPQLVPPNMVGTRAAQYVGDQSTQPNPKSGTPYDSRHSNADQYSRTVEQGRYGKSLIAGGVDLNDVNSMNGVAFDGVSKARDLIPTPALYPDSPVPAGAQRPDTDSAQKLNSLRNGVGEAWPTDKTIADGLVEGGGTMSRD